MRKMYSKKQIEEIAKLIAESEIASKNNPNLSIRYYEEDGYHYIEIYFMYDNFPTFIQTQDSEYNPYFFYITSNINSIDLSISNGSGVIIFQDNQMTSAQLHDDSKENYLLFEVPEDVEIFDYGTPIYSTFAKFTGKIDV